MKELFGFFFLLQTIALFVMAIKYNVMNKKNKRQALTIASAMKILKILENQPIIVTLVKKKDENHFYDVRFKVKNKIYRDSFTMTKRLGNDVPEEVMAVFLLDSVTICLQRFKDTIEKEGEKCITKKERTSQTKH